MEHKFNEATPLRPEGDRLLNAPLVQMDLNDFIKQIKSESTWAESDKNSLTIYKSDSMRLVLIGLRTGGELPPHKANGVINVQVVTGNILFTTADESISLKTGQIIALQEKILHSVKAIEESFFLLTLCMNK